MLGESGIELDIELTGRVIGHVQELGRGRGGREPGEAHRKAERQRGAAGETGDRHETFLFSRLD